jgi:cytochrome c oxidase subunit 4
MTATGAVQAHEETLHGTGRAHPSDRNYVTIAVILALITAAEVVTFYIEDRLGSALLPILLVMMVAKFFIVAAWFMHLRFDSIMFRRFFIAGLVLAVLVFLAVMASMQVFGDDTVSIVLNPDGQPANDQPGNPVD